MKLKHVMIGAAFLPLCASAQMHIENGGDLFLQKEATITLQGDFETDDDIEGDGTLLFNGNYPQQIDAHNYALSKLQIENKYGVSFVSGLKVSKSLILSSGLASLGRNTMIVGDDASIHGSASSYLVTTDEGSVVKSVDDNLNGFLLPIGTNVGYAPIILTSIGKYNNAMLKITANSKASPNKGASVDYLQQYWTIGRKGITGEVHATAFYNRVSGNEINLRAYYWNGHEWLTRDAAADISNKTFSVNIPEGTGEIYAMSKGHGSQAATSSMELLPNPVHNTARIIVRSVADETATFRITDNAGVVIIQQRAQLRRGLNHVNINATALPAGQYIITSTRQNQPPLKMIKR